MSLKNKAYTPGVTEVYYISLFSNVRKGIIQKERRKGEITILRLLQYNSDNITYYANQQMESVPPDMCFLTLKDLLTHFENLEKLKK